MGWCGTQVQYAFACLRDDGGFCEPEAIIEWSLW